MSEPHKLNVFLCHASQDKPIVRELYQRLKDKDWIDPWLDQEKLLPGQDWDLEIERAVESSDAVIVCLSTNSVSKEGYIQRELRFVLDIALEKPEGTIFVVPLRLDECELPRRLRSWHFVDYFPVDQKDSAFERLLQSLEARFDQVRSKNILSEKVDPKPAKVTDKPVEGKKVPQQQKPFERMAASLRSSGSGTIDVGGSVFQILYFSLAALSFLAPSDTLTEILMGISAVLAGFVFLIKKQIPASIIFKIAVVIFLLLFGLGYRIESLIPFAPFVAGVAAIISGGMLLLNVQNPKKPVYYSSISFAIFLFLVGIYYIWTNIAGYPDIISEVDTLILITSIVTAVLLLRDL